MASEPQRSFAVVAAAIVVAAVMISGTLFAVLGSPATVTETSTLTQVSTSTLDGATTIISATTVTTTLPPNCTTTFPGGLSMEQGDWSDANQSSEGLRLFTMRPGSLALLCVSYTLDSQASSNEGSQNATFSGDANIVEAFCDGSGCSYNYTESPGINVSGSPPSITLAKGENLTEVDVMYTISASASSQGFYSLSFFNSCPALLPLAVLPAGQTADGSDYNGFFLPGSCVQYGALEDGIVTGVAGMNVSWIYA